jgi:positive regulator of sigma E activity
MTEETGVVIDRSGSTVTVSIERDSKCSGCRSCFADAQGTRLLARAHDTLHVDVGERVKLRERNVSSGKAGLLLFGLPLLTFVPGFIGGQALGRLVGLASPEVLGLPAGLVGFAIPFLILYLQQRRRVRRGVHSMEVVGKLGDRPGSTSGAE